MPCIEMQRFLGLMLKSSCPSGGTDSDQDGDICPLTADRESVSAVSSLRTLKGAMNANALAQKSLRSWKLTI